MQTTLDFTHRENNRESEQHYEEIVASKQSDCKRILAEMLKGRRVTSDYVTYDMGIRSATRRIHDLKDENGDPLWKWAWVYVNGRKHHKEYFITNTNLIK